MQTLNREADFSSLLRSRKIVVVQFGSAACAPCSAIHQKLTEWLCTRPEIASVYIPVEEFSSLSAQLGVFTVPTIFVYADGQLTIRTSGYFSLEDVLSQIERYRHLLSN